MFSLKLAFEFHGKDMAMEIPSSFLWEIITSSPQAQHCSTRGCISSSLPYGFSSVNPMSYQHLTFPLCIQQLGEQLEPRENLEYFKRSRVKRSSSFFFFFFKTSFYCGNDSSVVIKLHLKGFPDTWIFIFFLFPVVEWVQKKMIDGIFLKNLLYDVDSFMPSYVNVWKYEHKCKVL